METIDYERLATVTLSVLRQAIREEPTFWGFPAPKQPKKGRWMSLVPEVCDYVEKQFPENTYEPPTTKQLYELFRETTMVRCSFRAFVAAATYVSRNRDLSRGWHLSRLEMTRPSRVEWMKIPASEYPPTASSVCLRQLVGDAGLTVAELKRHIADWPETDANGDPTEVWIETGDSISGPCVAVELLNLRTKEDGSSTSDLLFRPAPPNPS